MLSTCKGLIGVHSTHDPKLPTILGWPNTDVPCESGSELWVNPEEPQPPEEKADTLQGQS